MPRKRPAPSLDAAIKRLEQAAAAVQKAAAAAGNLDGDHRRRIHDAVAALQTAAPGE